MEIGESLVGAYLKHVVGCDVVLFNIHLADVQGELDVVGIKTKQDGQQQVWLIEVTTHLLGMLYKTPSETVKKILEKKSRAEQFAGRFFVGAEVTFEVWSPIVSSGTVRGLEAESIRLVANDEYTRRVNILADHAAKSTQTTGDDAFRMLQLLTHLRGRRPRFEFDKHYLGSADGDSYVLVPAISASSEELHRFAQTYNAYTRLFSDLEDLQLFFAPQVEQFERTKELGQNLGVDYLRALLFTLSRADHFVESFWDRHEDLARVIVRNIRLKAGFKVLDLS